MQISPVIVANSMEFAYKSRNKASIWPDISTSECIFRGSLSIKGWKDKEDKYFIIAFQQDTIRP